MLIVMQLLILRRLLKGLLCKPWKQLVLRSLRRILKELVTEEVMERRNDGMYVLILGVLTVGGDI
jgi:hypothetical protein